MALQQKGKQGTKGAKQIIEENLATVAFYRNMALGSLTAYLVISLILYEITKFTLFMGFLSMVILLSAYEFMLFMSRPKYTDTGSIVDSGVDLNMEGGISEHVKDLIILTSGTILLSLLSNYFWLVLMLAPTRVLWMLWGTVLKPWISQKQDEQCEVDEKKQKKLERKMKRMR